MRDVGWGLGKERRIRVLNWTDPLGFGVWPYREEMTVGEAAPLRSSAVGATLRGSRSRSSDARCVDWIFFSV